MWTTSPERRIVQSHAPGSWRDLLKMPRASYQHRVRPVGGQEGTYERAAFVDGFRSRLRYSDDVVAMGRQPDSITSPSCRLPGRWDRNQSTLRPCSRVLNRFREFVHLRCRP